MLLFVAPRQKNRRLNTFYKLMVVILVIISLYQKRIKVGRNEGSEIKREEGKKEGNKVQLSLINTKFKNQEKVLFL